MRALSKLVPVAIWCGVPIRAVRDPGLSSEPPAGKGTVLVLRLFLQWNRKRRGHWEKFRV